MGLDPSPSELTQPCGCKYVETTPPGAEKTRWSLAETCEEHRRYTITITTEHVDDWAAVHPRRRHTGSWGLIDHRGWEIWETKPYPGPETGLPDIWAPLTFKSRGEAKAWAVTKLHAITHPETPES